MNVSPFVAVGLLCAACGVRGAVTERDLPAYQRLVASVDDRLTEGRSCDRFVGYPGKAKDDVFVANTNFWGRGIDFSCVSPWNSGGGTLRAGTLISKRHVIFAKHFPLWKGVRIVFVGENGGVCPARIEATRAIERSDVMIGLLDYEVTPDVHPAKILPVDYRQHIGSGAGLPIVTFNQREQALVRVMTGIITNLPSRHMSSVSPFKKTRAAFSDKIVVGDSGNPSFLIDGNEPILVFCLLGFGSGPGVHYFRNEIQRVMDELCPGYKLESFDFKGKVPKRTSN